MLEKLDNYLTVLERVAWLIRKEKLPREGWLFLCDERLYDLESHDEICSYLLQDDNPFRGLQYLFREKKTFSTVYVK